MRKEIHRAFQFRIPGGRPAGKVLSVALCLAVLCAPGMVCGAEATVAASAKGRTAEERVAMNLFSVARAARAAGYEGQWTTVAEMAKDLTKGVEIRLGDNKVFFNVEPLTATEIKAANEHISIEKSNGVGIPVWKE